MGGLRRCSSSKKRLSKLADAMNEKFLKAIIRLFYNLLLFIIALWIYLLMYSFLGLVWELICSYGYSVILFGASRLFLLKPWDRWLLFLLCCMAPAFDWMSLFPPGVSGWWGCLLAAFFACLYGIYSLFGTSASCQGVILWVSYLLSWRVATIWLKQD